MNKYILWSIKLGFEGKLPPEFYEKYKKARKVRREVTLIYISLLIFTFYLYYNFKFFDFQNNILELLNSMALIIFAALTLVYTIGFYHFWKDIIQIQHRRMRNYENRN